MRAAEAPPQAAPEPNGESPRPASPKQRPQYTAIATPDAKTGAIEVVIADHSITCARRFDFPQNCESAWRIRLYLPPGTQRQGRYALEEGTGLFAYREAQEPLTAGGWTSGTACATPGGQLTGKLAVDAVDDTGISGTISEPDSHDLAFRAVRCPWCRGVGMACSSNAECCNDFCHEGACQP